MGAAAAVFASSELANRVHGYILECPYSDLKTAVRNRTRYSIPPILDWIAFQGLLIVSPLILPELDKISTVDAINGIPSNVPVLIMAGGKDARALPEEAQALFERVRVHGELEIFSLADHVRLQVVYPDRYRKSIIGFIRKAGGRSSLANSAK